MKKLLTFILVLFSVFVLAGCRKGNKKNIEAILLKASKMTEKELLEAAKNEIGENKLTVMTQASGVAKSIVKFKEKYNINFDEDAVNSAKKDMELYTALDVVPSERFLADFVVIQDAKTLKNYMKENILFNYIPNKDEIKLDEEDTYPLSIVYYNRLFLYNKKDILPTAKAVKNVWQLAGTGADPDHISRLSIQSPVQDNINMNFFLTLTSEKAVKLLEKSYKEYYKKDYVKEDKYINIGYKFIAEFCKNVSTWHKSDTTAVKETIPADKGEERTVFFSAFAKYKNLIKTLGNDAAAEAEAGKILGWDHEVEGFKGFLYKMYGMIPRTAKYPYTACLFARFMLTEAGFNAAFGGQYGYYSANKEITKVYKTDKPLSYWKERCLSENGNFLATLKQDVSNYIRAQVINK